MLRRVLGESAGDNRFIVTVPGRGYRFVADVRQMRWEVLPNSVAVLPMEDLTVASKAAYFALALHAEIVNQLSKVPGLTVINRESVRCYSRDPPPLAQIAAELKVQSLLLGTLRIAAGRIRLAVQLVDPLSGANLWANEYEHDVSDQFAVQVIVARKIARALQTTISLTQQSMDHRLDRRGARAVRR